MIKLLHPAEGVLRRLLDEPLLVPDRTRAHVRACSRCDTRLGKLAAAAEIVETLLPSQPELAPDSRAALAALRRRFRTLDPSVLASRRAVRERLPRPLAHASGRTVAASAVVVLVAATGMGTAVAGVHWTRIFEPSAVAPVPVSRAELLALPHLSEFGRLTPPHQPKLTPEASLAASEAASGVTLSLPSSLPQGVSGSPSFLLVPRMTATFTFSSARAEAAGLAAGAVLPPLPPGFDGTQLRESVGPGVLVVYGIGASSNPLADLPALALMAVRPPVVESTGVTVQALEHYLLRLPFLLPSLAAALRQLGNPITTLPIPILPAMRQSQATTVNGAKAVLLALDNQVASAVVWESRGTVRAVGGLLSSKSVLALARG